ncbi:uncharacterized protein [Procambarus clarkii]|uniref:uncharacterized protein isoform X2 n=1 Tax=Procambarus clarkii TaxID=6728 RepID=UPI003744A6D9
MEANHLVLTGALLAVAVATVAGQEGTVAVVSIPGVSGYLANPCHLLAQQENHQVDSRVTFNQLRQVALTNIIFANVTLHAIQNILNSDCNIPFSLNTLPPVPSLYNLQQQDAFRVMHREFIFLLAHLYFAINNTDPATTTCTHETRLFSDELRGLSGMLENIMCRLTVLVQSESQLAPAVREVTSLRLQHEASCGGRSLWTCILASRMRRALSMLRRVLLQHGRHNHSPANNSVVSTQQKRFSQRRGPPYPRQGVPLDSLHRRPSAVSMLPLREYQPRTYSSDSQAFSLLDYNVQELSNALSSPNNLNGSSNSSPGLFNAAGPHDGSNSYSSHDYLLPADSWHHFGSVINKFSGTSNLPDSSSSMNYINTVTVSPSRLSPRGSVFPPSSTDLRQALANPASYFPLRGYFLNQDRAKDQHMYNISGSSNLNSFPSNSWDSGFLFHSNILPKSSHPSTYSNVSYTNKPNYLYTSSYSINNPYSYPSIDFNSRP